MSLACFRYFTKKIVCVERNYKDQTQELNNPIPQQPLLFVKTTNALIDEGEAIVIPPGCTHLEQEVELAIVISKTAKNVSKEDAMSYVGGYVAALDMTARDFQDEAKKDGAPWFMAKSFDTSCPVSMFMDPSMIPDPHNEEIYCIINGVEKQRGATSAMIFDIPTLIEYTTKFFTLEEGDILLTGTPAGVCKVVSGDVIEFGVTGRVKAKFKVE